MNKSQEKYTRILRVATLCVVAFLWGLSIVWSADGFSINKPSLRWIGIGLAISVTVSQLVFNRGSANPTIFLVGLAAYIYGFATNFIGISKIIGLDFTSANLSENPFGFIASGLGVIALAVIVEAAPESFLLWAIYPKEKTPGDFISSLAGGINLPKQGRSSKRSAQRSNVQMQNVLNRSSNRSNNVPERVQAYVERYKAQNGGKIPSYGDIVKNTPLTSKSQVKPVLKQLGL